MSETKAVQGEKKLSLGKGTKFNIDSIAVGSLNSIGAVEKSADTTEVTTLDNADGYKTFLGGMKDGGEVAIEGYMDGGTSNQDKMDEAFEDQQVHKCEIVFPEAIKKTWKFDGIVTKFSAGGATVGDALKFSASVKISGKPTLVASGT